MRNGNLLVRMAVAQVVWVGVVVTPKAVHMGSGVLAESGPTYDAHHSEVEEHDSDMETAAALETHLPACRVPSGEVDDRRTGDEMHMSVKCQVSHHTVRWPAALDHMPRLQSVPGWSKVEDLAGWG